MGSKADSPNTECPICLEDTRTRIATRPPCGHEVCIECLFKMQKRVCAICRAEIPALPGVCDSPVRVPLSVITMTPIMIPRSPIVRPAPHLRTIRFLRRRADLNESDDDTV